MHLGFKIKLGILHLRSDSPAERRRKRSARTRKKEARKKRRVTRRQKRAQRIQRRANARWNQRVREPVVASTKPRAVRDDARSRRQAERTVRANSRAAAARADAARVTTAGAQPVQGVVHPAEGPAPARTPSGVPRRQATMPEYMEMSEQQQAEYAALPLSVTGGTFRLVTSEGQTQEEWQRAAFPDGHPREWAAHQPRNAHGQPLATDGGGWPSGTQSWATDTGSDERGEKLRAAGLCGARTQDGGRCNRRGNCPYHSNTLV